MAAAALHRLDRLWPLPALGTWALAWATFALLRGAGTGDLPALLCATAIGAALALAGRTRWRRLMMAGGFPLSLAASGGAAGLPAWAWLLPLAALAMLYPLRSWRDAPLFPTPSGALAGLAAVLRLPPGASVLDAGCGLGDGLIELHHELPATALTGWEWSRPLRRACARRCPFATVERRDIWAADWAPFNAVYLFQRPESMARAADKASCQMRPGTWLVSLEFEVPGVAPAHRLEALAGKPVWVYRVPLAAGTALPQAASAAVPASGSTRASARH